MKWCCGRKLTTSLFSLFLLCSTLLWLGHASAAPSAPQKQPDPIPMWVYDGESFEFWRDAQGNYQGLYPRIVSMLNERFGYNIQIRPISGDEIGQRFNSDSYGLYGGVIRTEDRARSKILSSRLFDNEVVAASIIQRVLQRYPYLKFRELRLVDSSEEAFRLLSDDRADFYINDASEMDNTARYYQLSRPFPALRITCVFAFSPQLRAIREDVNQLINDEYRSGKMRQLILENKRQFLLSRVSVNETERGWLSQNTLDVWLPRNENYAPLIWRDREG